MANLIDDAPEAQAFCEAVADQVDRYKLFSEETFSHVMSAVLSTTGVDSQGHAFTREQLEGFAATINAGRHWGGAHHDPRIHPISRGLAAKIFYSSSSDLYFLAAVIGYYEAIALPSFSDIGIDIDSLREVDTTDLPRLPVGPYAKLAVNPQEVDVATFEVLLSSAPEIVNSRLQGRFRKAAELPTVITLVISFWVLAGNPFSKKFLERYGEVAADQSLKFFAWLKDKVVEAVSKQLGPRVMFEIDSLCFNCQLQFVVASADADVLKAAVATLQSAAASAYSLVHALHALEPLRLGYEFDASKTRWLPLHATTAKRGVISGSPFSDNCARAVSHGPQHRWRLSDW